MDWKKRRTLPSSQVKRVAIVGGTHGNETNGVYLARHFMRSPDLVKRPSFETEVFLSNEAAVKQNTRYVEEDLNRCYLLADLTDSAKATASLERKRALEVDRRLGPKSAAEPRCDLVIDLHNTTSATDIALLMAPDDDFAHELGHHLMSLDDGVRIVNWNTQPDWALCPSVGRSGMTFEVGACPWGCIVPDLFQRSQKLLVALLDYVEAHNGRISAGKVARQNVTVPVYRSLGISIDYPRTADGDLDGMVHPDLQGRDFGEIKEGDNLFLTFGGAVQKFNRKDHKVPDGQGSVYAMFVNEAAYYEKKVALMLFDKSEKTFSKSASA
mmetsp:Transcript_36291/g.104426  ORF Transcript_36291/g.104426 Transcript_36291/m.104426 type:complete len:326 (+) Transcript_36291:96-1073(+)